MAAAARVLLEPAVQDISIHPMDQGHCGNRRSGQLTGADQLSLECAARRIWGASEALSISIHDDLRGHDIVRGGSFAQDAMPTRLRTRSLFPPKAAEYLQQLPARA